MDEKSSLKEEGGSSGEQSTSLGESAQPPRPSILERRIGALRWTLGVSLGGLVLATVANLILSLYLKDEYKNDLNMNTLILVFGFIATSIVAAFIGSSFLEGAERRKERP